MAISSVITNVVPSTRMAIPSAINKANTTVAITSATTTTAVSIVVITSDTTSKNWQYHLLLLKKVGNHDKNICQQ